MVTSFFSRFWRTIGELYNSKGNSVLRYRGRDGKVHYVASSEDPDSESSASIPVIAVAGATPTQKLDPNKFYKFGVVTSLTLTMTLPTQGILNIYAFAFTAGEGFDASTDITWPEGVVLDRDMELEEGDYCEVSIRENKAVFTVWSGAGDASGVADPEEDGES